MKTMRYFILSAMFLMGLAANAQSKMKVILKSGSESTFVVSDIEKIIWSEGDSDSDAESLNSYEEAFIGTWIEKDRNKNTEQEVFELTFNTDHTAILYIYDYGNVTKTINYVWSATATTITMTGDGETDSESYTINNNLLTLSQIVYKKVGDGSDNGEGTDTGVPDALEAIDLGLSSGTKWANMNLGATEVAGSKINSHTGNPDCYGEYYSWGETAPKDDYSISTYTQTGLRELTPESDAATVNWGAEWHMPSKTEIDELLAQCSFEWTTDYNGTGIMGYIVSGPNNNTIFMPAAGCKKATNWQYVGSYVCSWTSTYYNNLYGVYALVLDYIHDDYDWDACGPSRGNTIRPVSK